MKKALITEITEQDGSYLEEFLPQTYSRDKSLAFTRFRIVCIMCSI